MLTRRSNLEWLNLPDCISLNEYGHCSLKGNRSCLGHGCPFLVTEDAANAAQTRTMRRLASLDEAAQQRIANKYYGGKRIWA